jgi:hypothetical protein
MVVRLLIAGFASFVAGLSYLTGLGRLMTGMLLGFGACSAVFFGVLFSLSDSENRLWFPVYETAPTWPFFLLAVILIGLTLALFLMKNRPASEEQVAGVHFKYLFGGIGGYLTSLFLSSVYWFPSDARRLSTDVASLEKGVLLGTCLFVVGISLSCFFFYKASKGTSERHPDLMRRFVLGLFTFFQFDKMPLLVAYLLIYSPDTRVIFPHIAAFALASYIPVAIFLLKTTLESRDI